MTSGSAIQTNHELTAEQLRDIAVIIQEISDIIIVTDKNGVINSVHGGLSNKLGLKEKETSGIHLATLFENMHADKAKTEVVKKALKKGVNYNGIIATKSKTGTTFWCEVKMNAVKDARGRILKFILFAKDVTDHIKKNEELLYSELRWKFALEESGDGFFEYDLVNHKFFGSDNLLALLTLGDDLTQLNFPALANIIHPEDTETAVNALFDLLAGKIEMLRHELRLKNKDGNYAWMIIRATISSKSSAGEPLTLIGTTTDISQLKETEAQLLKAKIEADKASEYKNQFLATMSHEIRTPLNAIIGMTDLMLMESPVGELKENLGILSFSANHLLSLINDVLDLSKIESGKIEFVHSGFNPEETIKRIFQTFLPRCKETGIIFSYTVDKTIPPVLLGDALRLTQIMNNLVNNAIKFTPQGSVKISVKQLDNNGKKARLLFKVVDTGIGIDKHKQEQIFHDFVQADATIAHKYGGTGLGLAITKKLIELQGGKVYVDSTPGKGSRFYFELEFDIQQKQAGKSKQSNTLNRQDSSLKNVQVLLVEDIIANQKVATSYLKHWQAGVKCAANGIEALKLFKKHDFDILLVDLYMPGMNGFDLIEKIRQLPKGKSVPIIALTASIETNIIKMAIDCGANICMGKPFEAGRLFEAIQKLTNINKAGKLAVAIPVKNKTEKNRFKTIHLKRIEDASLGKKQFVKDMVKLIKGEIADGMTECTKNLQSKNYIQFSASIHKLKNSLMLIGLDVLRTDLEKLEHNAKTGKQLNKLNDLFAQVDSVWQKASKELNSI